MPAKVIMKLLRDFIDYEGRICFGERALKFDDGLKFDEYVRLIKQNQAEFSTSCRHLFVVELASERIVLRAPLAGPHADFRQEAGPYADDCLISLRKASQGGGLEAKSYLGFMWRGFLLLILNAQIFVSVMVALGVLLHLLESGVLSQQDVRNLGLAFLIPIGFWITIKVGLRKFSVRFDQMQLALNSFRDACKRLRGPELA